MAPTPIDLERVFVELTEDEARDEAKAEMAIRFARARSLRRAQEWTSVLEHRHIVVLGEAGSGKSTEFRAQCDRIRARDLASAFFLPLTDLAATGIFESLSTKDANLLRGRLNANSDVTLFLDSVDEGKLAAVAGTNFLARILERLEADLGTAKASARIVLSCRGSDWRFEDRAAFEQLEASEVATARGQGVEQSRVRVFHLIPLDDRQVRFLAEHRDVPNIDGLMDEIAESGSRALVERPLDVLWIGDYWAVNGRLGTRSELLENNVLSKLRDKPGRASSLTDLQALEAAERLAGIGTLSATRTFALPDVELAPGWSATSVDSRGALQHLAPDEVTDLLSRGLFDAPTFGRVRIHDGPVQEYLAARWLQRLLDSGVSRTRVASILFRQSGSRRVVPSHLRGTAAWLAAWDPRTKRDLLEVAPELLIDEGDPSQIPPEDRRAALQRWAHLLRTGERAQHWFDRAGLARFGSPVLAGAINTLLEDRELTAQVEEMLFEIAAQARLSDCVPRAHSRAIDPTVDPNVRYDATRTVCRAGTASQRQSLVGDLERQDPIPEQVVGALVSELFPRELDIPILLRLLGVVAPPDDNHVTVLTVELGHHIPNELDHDRALLLLEGLLNLATELQGGRRVPHERHGWLLKHLCNLLVAILRRAPTDPATVVDEALSLCNWHARSPGSEPVLGSSDLYEVITTTVALRRRVFWLVARDGDDNDGVIIGQFLFLSRFVQLSPQDLSWLADDAEHVELPQHRLLAFDSLLQVDDAHPSIEAAVIVERLIGKFPELRDHQAERLKKRSQPHPELVLMAQRTQEHEHRKAEKRRERHERLTSQRDLLAQGRQLSAVEDIWDDARNRDGDFGSYDLDKAVAVHGRELVDAARTGLKRCWRDNDAPIAGSGGAAPPFRLMLAGIALEIDENKLDVAKLSADLQARLVRLATWELARFPRWLERIAIASPALVKEVLAPALITEIRGAVADQQWTVLSMVTDAPDVLRKICAPIIVRALLDTEPPRQPALEAAVVTLLACRTGLSDLQPVLELRCRQAHLDPSRFAIWWCVWLEVDASAALAALDALLAPNRETAAALLTVLGDRIWRWAGDEPRGFGLPLSVRTHVVAAAGLLGLLEKYLPDDADARTYAGAEGHTKLLRERLPSWISAVPGEGTVAALMGVADKASVPRKQSYFRELALGRASRNQSCLPLSIRDATVWAERLLLQPRSAEDLFNLALERLDDLRADLEGGDHSIRPIVNPKAKEPDLTTYVVSELENDAHGLYTVGREEEVDRHKKTDIRLHSLRVAPVVIEVKIAEQQTGPDLEDTLPKQLVGRYMRDPRSEFGILLVFSLGRANARWRTRDGRELGFREFLHHLAEIARELERTTSGVAALRVVGIDLH
jgi:hypothetical protein